MLATRSLKHEPGGQVERLSIYRGSVAFQYGPPRRYQPPEQEWARAKEEARWSPRPACGRCAR